MPWRSASASLPVAMSYLSRCWTSEAIAYGDEQSMRILPSWSSVMKRQVGSTVGLTTVRFRPRFSAMYSQYCTDAPPMGSAPIRTPDERIASRSIALVRSRQYALR